MQRIFTYLSLLCFVICLAEITRAQPAITWTKCIGGTGVEEAYCIKATTDGGFIVVGASGVNLDGDVTSNHGGAWQDAWVVKTDSMGRIEWQESLGGTEPDEAWSVIQTKDGGYVVAGETSSNDGDVSGNHGGDDCWIVKLSSQGTVQWQRCYGGTGHEGAFCIVQTVEGGYVFVGSTSSFDGDVKGKVDAYDIWVVKIDSVGGIVWQHPMGGSGRTPDESSGACVVQTSDSGYIVAGTTDATDGDVQSSKGGAGGWVIKLDSKGQITWEHMLGDSSTSGFGCEEAHCIIQTRDNGFMVVGGGCIVNVHGVQYWAAKLDTMGAIQWQKYYGGGGGDNAWSVFQTRDGGYVLGGDSGSNDGDVTGNHPQGGGLNIPSSDAWIVKLDSLGTLVWEESFGGSLDDFANSIVQTGNGSYTFVGYTNSQDGDVKGCHSHYDDMWIVKLSPEPSAILEDKRQPNNLSLYQNYPNPFSASTAIHLGISSSDSKIATLRIYNVLGVLAKDLTDQVRTGKDVAFTSDGLAAGIYSYKLDAPGLHFTRQMLVVK